MSILKEFLCAVVVAIALMAIIIIVLVAVFGLHGPQQYKCLVFNTGDPQIATEYRCAVSHDKAGAHVRVVEP